MFVLRSTIQFMNIVITGASRGIGKAVAAAFAAAGHHLYLSARNEATLQHTITELQKQFPSSTIQGLAKDLSVKEDVEAFGQWLLDQHIRIDVLVNNAGNYLPGGIYDEAEGVLEKMMDINLYSAYHLTRKLLPTIVGQETINGARGHIFNLCSIASQQAYPNGGAYGISKYAVYGFSKNLREEMKTKLVKVTAILPGAVLTDSWGDFDNSQHRIMEANDIAQMILTSAQLSPGACVEEIVIRPQLGDL
jgi:short-subunit dehydrogenase